MVKGSSCAGAYFPCVLIQFHEVAPFPQDSRCLYASMLTAPFHVLLSGNLSEHSAISSRSLTEALNTAHPRTDSRQFLPALRQSTPWTPALSPLIPPKPRTGLSTSVREQKTPMFLYEQPGYSFPASPNSNTVWIETLYGLPPGPAKDGVQLPASYHLRNYIFIHYCIFTSLTGKFWPMLVLYL